MAVIGWTTDVEADEYFSKDIQYMDVWAGLTVEKKEAALTTSFNEISYSKEVEIPSGPSPAVLSLLQYAQHKFAGILVVLGEGGARRAAAISQGVTSAGIVEESYDLSKAGKLPTEILGILDEFKTEGTFFATPIFRDETKNQAFDRNYPDY